MSGGGEAEGVQNVVVMRHGDRIDHLEPLWVAQAQRPWDPPLADEGRIRAWTAGKRLRDSGFPIHRVVVSPFLRCLQTAAEVVRALCCVVDDHQLLLSMETSRDAILDPSRVKVSIEYGLCEMLNTTALGHNIAPEDEKWFPHISELEASLPAGTIDHSAESIYKELPQWEESVAGARNRYATIIQSLADRYPNENLLLVSHGEAVGTAVASYVENTMVYEAEYCARCHLRRNTLSSFEVLNESGQMGVFYSIAPDFSSC
ncbi:uncharacterized protein LOC122014335 [Zingiber officinale]|uniref:Uncharacterized protein n=1 Tax=Zingiber officinale TaxID=94328 RepID=A0A8J5FA30_ZINOF|nr:uncharacterized protein LOC122014335 [Zingiber officinale]XP_042426476.1 uncharacterized protein LOC122014335 [Zingiber officinale]XP_042426477.1 uncharacterized protein LOC122014335 [Zingiber officinale]KAG6483956.1 hypothetical protein ZIOFF_060749 [Zingiber officinale]